MEPGDNKVDPVTVQYIIDDRPAPVNRWLGRSREFGEITAWLADPKVRLIEVTAAGGYGKSALVSQIYSAVAQDGAAENEAAKFDEVVWTNFSRVFSFELWARWLLQKLKIEVREGIRGEELIILLVNLLAARRYLLVLDNLETLIREDGQWEDEEYPRFLLKWVTDGAKGTIVTTSRDRALQRDLPLQAKHLPLGGLEPQDGVGLLRSLLVEFGISATAADVDEVVRRSDAHPLLLNLIGGWLATEGCTALAELKADLFGIMGLHRGDLEATVGKLLDASLKRLDDRRRSLLLNLSVYRSSFGVAAAVAMLETAMAEDLAGLVRRSLLQGQKQNTAWVCQFQPLVRRYVQQQAGDQTVANERALRFYLEQRQPLGAEVLPETVVPYLESCHYFCELGQYELAWQLLQGETLPEEDLQHRYSSCEMWLKCQGTGVDRLTAYDLFFRLVEEWQTETAAEQRQQGDALRSIGDVLQFLDRRDEALERYEQALNLYRPIGARLGEANTLQAIGDVLQFLKRCDEALERYEQALNLYRPIGARLGEANTLRAIGDVLQFLDRCDEALERYEQALNLYRPIGDRLGEANTLQAIGDVLQFLKRCDEALERYEQALNLYRPIGARLGEANTLKAIGDVLQFLDRRDEALERYEQALNLYRPIGDRLGEANTLRAIGDVLQFLDRRDEALERYEQALNLYRPIGARLGEANTLRAIGDVLQFLDRRDEALERYEQALNLYRPIGDRLGEANTLQAIGDVLQFLDRRDEALERYEQALNLYRPIGARLGEANTLKAIGDVLQFLDRRDEALERYEQALNLYRPIGDRLGEANTLRAIGDVLQFLDRRDEALERYEQALNLYRPIGARLGEANTLQAIGDLQTDLAQAMALFQQSWQLYVQIGDKYSKARILVTSIAPTQAKLGELAAAISSYQQAIDLADQIQFPPLRDYAQARLVELQQPALLWLQQLLQFAQRGWGQFALCFLLGFVAFPFLLVVVLLRLAWQHLRK